MRTPIVAAALAALLVPSVAFADEKSESEKAERAVHIGALVSAGAPAVVSGEAVLQYRSHLSFGLDYGMTPSFYLPIAAGAKIDASTMSFTARVRPFGGDLFLGVGLGNQRFNGVFTDPLQGPDVTTFTSTIFVMPQIGFLHRFKSGLAFGSDVGCELPIAYRMSEGPMPSVVEDVTRKFMKSPIPNVNLIRIGYVL